MADENDAYSALISRNQGKWLKYREAFSGEIDLRRAIITNRSLDGYNLSRCNLDEALFDGCALINVDFTECSIKDSEFRRCDLGDAFFDRSNLTGAQFTDCDLRGTDFSRVEGLTALQIKNSSGDETTELPDNISLPVSWVDSLEIEDEEELDDVANRTPVIPSRVLAPVETGWVDNKLVVLSFENSSNLRQDIEDRAIVALRGNLSNLVFALKDTNFDQRIVSDLNNKSQNFPVNSQEFRRRIFDVWFSLRPTFEYASATKGQHSDYIEALIVAFELNLRDVLISYPDWREYQELSNNLVVTNVFETEKFLSNQVALSIGLTRHRDIVDPEVPNKLNDVIDVQRRFPFSDKSKSVLYGAASSIANIISRVFQRAITQISEGADEGVKDGVKKLVSTVVAAGGAALIWMLSSGLQSFSWLNRAYIFVRNALGL